MATEIYQCPVDISLLITGASTVSRVRPGELFAVDSLDSAAIADILAQGLDIGPLDPIVTGVSFNDPDHKHAHNPYELDDPV